MDLKLYNVAYPLFSQGRCGNLFDLVPVFDLYYLTPVPKQSAKFELHTNLVSVFARLDLIAAQLQGFLIVLFKFL